MTHTPSSHSLTLLPNKDPFLVSMQTAFATDLERQSRLDRLSKLFNNLTNKKASIRYQIDELRSLQVDIKRLHDKI